jgi:hypothetical protein
MDMNKCLIFTPWRHGLVAWSLPAEEWDLKQLFSFTTNLPNTSTIIKMSQHPSYITACGFYVMLLSHIIKVNVIHWYNGSSLNALSPKCQQQRFPEQPLGWVRPKRCSGKNVVSGKWL